MRRFFLAICLLFPLFLDSHEKVTSVTKSHKKDQAVTYEIGGGRFGDQILSYLHAKWLSYRYGIPLLYRPFLYSDQLVLHKIETPYKESDQRKFKKVIHPIYQSKIDYEANISALYYIPYFPETQWEHTPQNAWYYFSVDWQDPGFKQTIKKLIKSESFKPLLKLSSDRINVAVHVRLGGGYDTSDTWKSAPLKLPPLQYYIEQIRHLYELLNQPLFIYVFTDDKDPPAVMEQLKRTTPDLDIEYACRQKGNAHNMNVLQDFFEITRFDCLIRPDSNFTIVASKIADFKIIISPVHFTWTGDNSGIVDEVHVEY